MPETFLLSLVNLAPEGKSGNRKVSGSSYLGAEKGTRKQEAEIKIEESISENIKLRHLDRESEEKERHLRPGASRLHLIAASEIVSVQDDKKDKKTTYCVPRKERTKELVVCIDPVQSPSAQRALCVFIFFGLVF
ncbi:hypothetical protein KQX54_015484 [Cotesia glomerata]|uniref:Uncharacterized protein n=1 Tax=Cotesia glomerata TaxID=32391 RepID=A0AAV7IR10_COTGL|nr:hypothetical protein KQX54_015484 [Cotesia glomerata]